MSKETNLMKTTIFQGKQIRRYWDEEKEVWYFSVTDVVGVLTDSVSPLAYWRKLKERLKKEGSESVTKCHALKMPAADGKMRVTDMADTETMFRLIQSIPSPNAEPFKLWLARVGYERVEEAADPELAIQRAMQYYLKKGYSEGWINQRLKSIEIRKLLTDEWRQRGVKGPDEFAVLTDDIAFAWTGMKTKDYKNYKGLKKENLRDNMTNLELVLNMLAEATTTEISQVKKPDTFKDNRKVAKQGGSVAGKARRDIERKTGKNVISQESHIKRLKNKQ
ncbi:MAG: Bro-N domain-containing protein [Candidatus Omnitrophica bacterium]|nr:Bro-N domain-containing protein [Candidatus Omnitrophota bacterium]